MATYEQHDTLKIQFIQTLEQLLLFDEWSDALLVKAEAECGFAVGYSKIIFPGELREVVDFFEDWQDQKMLKLLSKQEIPVKITDKINLALNIRIKNIDQLIHLRNRRYFAIPANMLFASKIAFRTCDVIWRYAGDTSIDYNYYTKRSLLFSVYISSILYYIQDESENNIDTDKYITKSLSGIITIFSKCKNIFKLPNPVDIPIIRLFL